MRAGEFIGFSNISADTAAFVLRGGKYGVTVIASGSGSVTLQRQANDGSTFVTCLTAFATTAGYATVDLPPGTYQLAIATFTAVYADIQRIPGD